MAGGRGPSWVLLGSVSAGIHILAGAAFFSVPPISATSLGPGVEAWNLTPIMVDDSAPEPIALDTPPPSPVAQPPKVSPPAADTPPLVSPPPVTPPPPPPPPVPTVKLGVDNGKADSSTWIAGKSEGEHQGPVMGTEQPQLARNPGPGGQPSPGRTPAPAGASAPVASPSPPSPATPDGERPPTPPSNTPPSDQSKPQPAQTPQPNDATPAPAERPQPPVELSKPRPPETPPRPPAEGAAKSPSEATATPPAPPAPPVPPFRLPEPVLDEGVGPERPSPAPDAPGVSPPPLSPPPSAAQPDAAPPEPAVEPPVTLLEIAALPAPDPVTSALRTAFAAAAAQSSPQAARPPSPGASVASPVAGGGDPNDRGSPSDRQSDAASVVRRRAEYRNGRVEAGEGIEIRTVRPVFSLVTRTMATPRSPLMEITFDRTGKARNVKVLRSSGYGNDVDEPIVSAMYQWRASGKALLELTESGPGEVRLEITIRLGGS